MAIIKKSGVGNILSGTIDGVEYVTTRTGTTYVRAVPQMPARIYKTPKALKRQALFRFIQMHRKYHFATISQSFSSVGSVSAANRYYSVNNKSLRMALDSLADRSVAGEEITISDVEAAICAYAVEHPDAICIASVTGYQEQYLTGEWPSVITLKALKGKDTLTIVVKEHPICKSSKKRRKS
jgi:hypothetical protein